MNHSKHDFNDDQISAYLDGELTGPECDRVVQFVTEHPDYRHTLDDLKSLQSELRLLPRYRLTADFHCRVLRQIDQLPDRTLASPVPDSDTASGPTASRKRWRALAWPLLALAATVLVALYIPFGFQPPRESEVAEAPDTGLPTPAVIEDHEARSGTSLELGLGDKSAAIEGDPVTGPIESGEPVEEAGGGAMGAFGGAVGAGAGAESNEAAELSSVPVPAGLPGNMGYGAASRGFEMPSVADGVAPTDTATASKSPAPTRGMAVPGKKARRGGMAGKDEYEADAPPSETRGLDRDSLAFEGFAGRTMDASRLTPADNAVVESVVKSLGENRVDLIVQVDMAQVDIGEKAFDASLVRNRIDYEPSTATDRLAPARSGSESSPSSLSETLGRASKPDPKELEKQAPAGPAIERYSELQNYDLVLVEAPAEQIQALVEELEQNSQQFPEVKLYVSNQWNRPMASPPADSARGRSAEEAFGTELAPKQMAGQYFYSDQSQRFLRERQDEESTEDRDSFDRKLEELGRARRITVHDLAWSEGVWLFQNKTAFQQHDHPARHQEPPGPENNRPDAKGSSTTDTRRLPASSPTEMAAGHRPLQALFLFNQRPNDPPAAAAAAPAEPAQESPAAEAEPDGGL